jgi:aminopeptidase N
VEAVRRSAQVLVRSYEVALDLTTGADTFRSTTTIRFASDGRPTFAELAPRRLCSASLNGVPLDSFSPGEGRLALTGTEGENELVVVADMAYAGNGQGVHRDVDPADGRTYLYASSALTAAPRWFACFDQPDLKAPLRLSLRCPAGWTVVGNGATASLAGDWWRLPATPAIPPHLAGFLAGPYHSHTAVHDGIKLGLHARMSQVDSLAAQAGQLLELTGRFLDEFHRLLAVRYPWGEYHQAFLPGLPWRGMENPGCVLYREPVLSRRSGRAQLVAHEMAHMWFGNLVTMRCWDELWLHESFAEYLAHRVTGSPTPLDRGAAVLAQLARRIGDAAFVRGLRAHLAEPGTMSYDEFVTSWSTVVPDFAGWARRWFRTAGADTVRVTENRLLRTGNRPHQLSVAAFGPDGRELTRVALAVDDETTGLPAFPATTALVLPNADGASWVKIQLLPEEWRRMPALLPRLDETARWVVWTGLRSGVEDGELDPMFAVDVAAAALPLEPSSAVLDRAARWLTGVVLATYLPDDEREQAERTLAGALGAAFRAAPPGSALEQAAARRWIDVAPVAVLRSLNHPRAQERLRALTADPVAKENAWTFILSGSPIEERYAAAKAFWQPAQRKLTESFVPRYFEEIPRLHGGIEAARLARFAFPRTAGACALPAAERLLGRPGLDPGVWDAVAESTDELRRAAAVRERVWRPTLIGNMVSPLVP